MATRIADAFNAAGKGMIDADARLEAAKKAGQKLVSNNPVSEDYYIFKAGMTEFGNTLDRRINEMNEIAEEIPFKPNANGKYSNLQRAKSTFYNAGTGKLSKGRIISFVIFWTLAIIALRLLVKIAMMLLLLVQTWW